MASGLPDPKMLQNLLDNRLVLDDADHPHFSLAFGTMCFIMLYLT